MAGGAYFAAFLVDRFSGGAHKALLRLATYLGVPLTVIGVLLLIVDLGMPIRFWRLLTVFNVVSAMSMGTWILFFWVGGAVIMIILWNAEYFFAIEEARATLARIAGAFSWVVFVFSALLMTYTGVLLASSNQPLWAGTILLPSLFVASAISTGVAIVLITALISRNRVIAIRTVARLGEADAVVIVIELAALIAWLGFSAVLGSTGGVRLLTTGALAVPFWLGVVLLAILIPLVLELRNWGREITTRRVWLAMVTSSLCVLLGGLILRLVVVVGGQM